MEVFEDSNNSSTKFNMKVYKKGENSFETSYNQTKKESLEETFLSAFESKKGREYLSKLEKFLKNPENINKVARALSYFDRSIPMRRLRAWWDQRDRKTQWILMKGTSVPGIGWINNTGPLQALMKFGFISYKGHYNEDPEKTEEAIDKMGFEADKLVEYGIKYGKYFDKKLSTIEPLVKRLVELKNVSNDTIRAIRHDMLKYRENHEKYHLHPQEIIATVNELINGVIDYPDQYLN